MLLLVFAWILAVVKVFVLEKYSTFPELVSTTTRSGSGSKHEGERDISINGNLPSSDLKAKFTIEQKMFIKHSHNDYGDKNKGSTTSTSNGYIPRAMEWLMTRSHQYGNEYNVGNGKDIHGNKIIDYIPNKNMKQVVVPLKNTKSINSNSNGNKASAVAASEHQHAQAGVHTDKDIEKNKWHKSSDLKWPPLTPNGDIPGEDGYEEMPLTKMKVPRFWYPKDGDDWNKVGRKINDKETIYLMIASYRDFQCRETIASAFNKATYPERLFVGAVDQVIPGDIGCLDLDIPCSQDPTQTLCKYSSQISVYKMDASYATGPVTARHIGDRMYRGEHYTMQMDAHCLFANHWDVDIINQWK